MYFCVFIFRLLNHYVIYRPKDDTTNQLQMPSSMAKQHIKFTEIFT